MRMRLLILAGLFVAALYGIIQFLIRATFRLILMATVAAPVIAALVIMFKMNDAHWHWTTLLVLPPLGALSIFTWQTQGDTVRRAGYFQRVKDLDKRTEVRYH